MRRTPFLVGMLVVAIVGGALLVRRWLDYDTRALASRLTQCPADQLEVDAVAHGDTEAWRVEGCGIRGLLVCEPSDAGCIVLPDEQ